MSTRNAGVGARPNSESRLLVQSKGRVGVGLSLQEKIEQQDAWTFKECLALAAEYNTKVRVVVVTVLACGKRYIDGERVSDEG